jgi:hypothetical protein
MVNHFLAALDGIAAPPTGIVWPDSAVNAQPSALRSALLGAVTYRQFNFLKALQLLVLVEESSLIDEITAVDTRVTYTRSQVVSILTSFGTAVQSTGASTTSVINLAVQPTVEYASCTIYTADGLTFQVSNDLGVQNTTTTFSGSGLSGAILTPDSQVTLTVSGGQPTAKSSWVATYWNPRQPLATTLVQQLDMAGLRPHIRTDLLDLFDRTPLVHEKIAAAIVSLARP